MPKKSKTERPQQKRQPYVHQEEWNRWKREAASPEYVAASFEVIFTAGKLTRQGFLEMMLNMDELHPGSGWCEQMNELEALYCKYNLALKELPRIERIEGIDGSIGD